MCSQLFPVPLSRFLEFAQSILRLFGQLLFLSLLLKSLRQLFMLARLHLLSKMIICFHFFDYVGQSRVGNVLKIPQMELLKALAFVNLNLLKGFFVHYVFSVNLT